MQRLRTITTFALLGITCYGCDAHVDWHETLEYRAIANDLLVEKGICAGVEDCDRKNLLFTEGGDSAYISLYQTSDAAVVDAITKEFEAKHATTGKPKITFTVYSSKHLEPKVIYKEIVID